MLRRRGSSMRRAGSGVQKSVPAMMRDAVGRATTAPGPNVPMTWLGRSSPRIRTGADRPPALLRGIETQHVDGTRFFDLAQRSGRVPVPPLSALGLAEQDVRVRKRVRIWRSPSIP